MLATFLVHKIHLAPGILLLSLLACQSGFEKAPKAEHAEAFWGAGTLQALDFVQQERLAELEFRQAKELHSILGYKRFLEKFPNAPEAKPAAVLLRNLRLENATAEGTPNALRRFLREYPDGPWRAELVERLAQMEQTELESSEDLLRLKGAAQFYADKPLGTLAGDRLDEIRFQNAKTASDYVDYLRQFPAGKHRNDARVALLSLEFDLLLAFSNWEEVERLSQQPLAKHMPQREGRLKQLRQLKALLESKAPELLQTQMVFSWRCAQEREAALQSADILLRAEAVEELGFWMDAAAMDALLNLIGTPRNALVRQRAFESLQRLLGALPDSLANHYVAKREQQTPQAPEGEEALRRAVLYDLSGQKVKAAALYSKAYIPQLPDPILLRRWVALRKEQKQYYSAAVAARQLAWWAERTVEDLHPLQEVELVFAARELCAATEMGAFAVASLEGLSQKPTEFPEDILAFLQKAKSTLRLAQARLEDAELALLEKTPEAKRCKERGLPWSIEAKVKERKAAFEKLAKRRPEAAKLLIRRALEIDPLVELRAELEVLDKAPPE